jgi:hypothetical protein
MTADEMQGLKKETFTGLGISLRFFESAAAMGFMAMVTSNFLSFAPIEERTWREIGVGFPVLFFCIIAIALVFRKNFFASFFIAIFSAFFITHEVIICYDNKAVEMGRELGAEGWFRHGSMIFGDVMQPSYGAFWGITGITLAIIAIFLAWIIATYKENLEAAMEADGSSAHQQIDFAKYEDYEHQSPEFNEEDSEEYYAEEDDFSEDDQDEELTEEIAEFQEEESDDSQDSEEV